MALIGTVEKMHVANVLVRMETFKKTGLFVVKQDSRWVEFYCREGNLVHIGPVRHDAQLGDRLVHDGIISEQELREAKFVTGTAAQNETRVALTLIDLGYVSQERLQSWTMKNAISIMRVVLSWKSGELYFEENVPPPLNRLIISLQISELIGNLQRTSAASSQQPSYAPREARTPVNTSVPEKRANSTVTLFEPSQFSVEPVTPNNPSYVPVQGNVVNTGPIQPPFVPQTPPALPIPSPQVNQSAVRIASLMQPNMVLVAAEIPSLPNQDVVVTPEQWRLLTQIDGKHSLLDTCFALNIGSDDVCLLAGELIAERLVNALPLAAQELQGGHPAFPTLPNTPNILNMPNLPYGAVGPAHNAHDSSGFATHMQLPFANAHSIQDAVPHILSTVETHSQWGNGDSGVTFRQGQGWVSPSGYSSSPPSIPPLQPISF